MRSGFLCAPVLWLATALPVFAAAPPQFVAVRIDHAIKMDGTLNDPAWQKTRASTTAFEAWPHPLTPSPYPMSVRVLYNDRYLYVGIEAGDAHPELIREHFERRDKLFSPNSDDVLLLYLDALDTGRSAQMFAVNPRDNQLDGFWSEDAQSEDYASDFNWTSASTRTGKGWTTVMRIPFSSLRYRPGRRQVWKLIVWRNVIRGNFYQIASTKIPNGNNCLMCYAGNMVLDDFPLATASNRLSVTPEVAVTHKSSDGDFGNASNNDINVGGYLSWQPHAGTVVDGMWNPDFSQIESDQFQPTANNQFALLFPEKRPFFLESKNLFGAPIQAIYTRSITEPRWGLRLTQQTHGGLFTLLAGQDRGGGSLIEPGVLSSTLVPQPGSSLATVGRMQQFGSNWRVGGLFTYRHYSDGSYNAVAGPDILLTPTDADRIRAQYLFSATRNPDRPDLYTGWQGQSFDDSAAFLDWSHGTGTWWWQGTYKHLGRNFRAWEGYVPQVGINELDATAGYNVYPPPGGWVNYIDPQLLYTRTDDVDGNAVLRSFGASTNLSGPQSSNLVLTWYPDDRQLTTAGIQHLRYTTLTFSSNPGASFTYFSATLRGGENVDYLTGNKGSGPSVTVNLQAYPVDRLELYLTASYQRLSADRPLSSSSSRLFDERGAQLRALWYFASDLYLELSTERDIVHRNADNYTIPVDANDTNSLYTLMLAYEPGPRTHFYVGMHRGTAHIVGQPGFAGDQTQFFVKMAYDFSM